MLQQKVVITLLINTDSIKGYLEVIDSENRQALGYISKDYNQFGEYGVLTNDSADYLLVSLDVVRAGGTPWNTVISTIVSIRESFSHLLLIPGKNGPLAAYPFFGAITGFNSTSGDLKEGYYK